MKLKRTLKIAVVFSVIVFSIPVGLFLFRNLITDYLIETAGSKAAGAVVEVDGVDLDLFKTTLGWERLQVTDRVNTWKNILETGRCSLDFELKPLLAGKLIIQEMTAGDLRTGSNRLTDGKIVTSEKGTASEEEGVSFIAEYVREKLEKEKSNIPVLNLSIMDESYDAGRLIDELELKTPAKIEAFRKTADEKYQYWNQKLIEEKYETTLREIRGEIKKLESSKYKTPEEIGEGIATALKIVRRSDGFLDEIKGERKKLQKDLLEIRALKEEVPRWIKEDYETVRARAKLSDISTENIGKMLFGERVTGILTLVVDALENVRQNSRKLSALEKESQTQSASGTSHKENMPELPRFWLKRLTLSFETPSGLLFKGIATDISSSRVKAGNPLRVLLDSDTKRYGKIKVSGVLDHNIEHSKENMEILIADIPLTELDFSGFPLLPESPGAGSARASFKLDAADETLAVRMECHADGVTFDLSGITHENKRVEALSRDIAQKIKNIDLKAVFNATGEKIDLDFETNLDQLIYGEIKKSLARELAKTKKELDLAVGKKLGAQQKGLEMFLSLNERELDGKMELILKDARLLDDTTDKKLKKLEKKLKTGALDNILKDGKDFFKKFKF